MKYYSQYHSHELFEFQESLSCLSKSNYWVKLADNLPWDKIEQEYNKRLKNRHNGAGNKPARMVIGALIVKHVEGLSDEKTIQAIQENPYMQYLLGLPKFTEKPVFVPDLFVLVRKRLDHEFFNLLTLLLSEADGSKPKKVHTDEDGNDHGGTMKVDATCCDAEVRYPTNYTYVDHPSWDAYNESSDIATQLELYRKRFGMLPQEVQADKLYLGKANRNLIKDCHVDCYNHPLGQPPKEENDCHAEDKKRAIGERNEIEATFGTSKRVYRVNDIKAKLDNTADTWIGACFFAKTQCGSLGDFFVSFL